MPPTELINALVGPYGAIVALVIGLTWMAQQRREYKKCYEDEREKRNQDALLAAAALTEQKMLNRDAVHQIEMRDYRLQDTQNDLTECKQELMQYRTRQAGT